MKINIDKCTGCGKCLKFCTMGAISIFNKKAIINANECIDCGVCLRLGVCEYDAFFMEENIKWPRTLRAIFSDPLVLSEETKISGRGTEEMKTNDVTDRFNDVNYIGLSIDIGRPNVGCSIKDVEKITQALAQVGVEFEKNNPTTSLMKDVKTGCIKEEVIEEKVLSCVVECIVSIDRISEVIDALKAVGEKVNTVYSVGVISKVNDDLSIPVVSIMGKVGISFSPDGKTNVGLGRK
ncbi:MAG: 4Fe-4S dicluster domain-containing protein [Dysgonamonadaceae bacterium]|nr:4Fe-4S dicluster domain-containing protein [Dysgonamonadaceae bacterium]